MASSETADGASSPARKAELRAGALRLPDVLFQGMTHMGPAVGIVFTYPFIASYAGTATTLSLIGAVIIMFFVANTVAEFSKYMPSPGGYHSFVTRGLGPKTGFMTAWSYFAYDPLGPPAVLGFLGFLAHDILLSGTGVNVPWWVFAVAGVLLTWVLVYRGITISTKVAVSFGALEILIMLALMITFLVHPAHSYSWTAPFNPGNSAQGIHGLVYGVLFSLLALSGFESVAPLARETRNPKKLLPRAIFGSLILIGLLFILAGYASVVGWGVGNMKSFASNPNPYYALARQLWGAGWIFVFIAIINSVLAIAIASSNAVTRVWYGMGTVGAAPRGLAKVHPRYQTPTKAVHLQFGIALALLLGVGFWVGPSEIYGFLGDIITVTIIVMYCLANVALYLYMRRHNPAEFQVWRHAVIPALGTILLLPVIYVTFTPAPAYPLNLVPYIVIAWLLIGGAIMIWNWRRNPARARAVAAAIELADSDGALLSEESVSARDTSTGTEIGGQG